MPPYEFYSHIVEMGKAIHEDYREKQQAEGKHVEKWEDLIEQHQYSSIRQAFTYPIKVDAVGCYITKKESPEPPAEFTEEEKEIMAKKEHDLWMEEKVEQKYVFDEIRDDKKLRHNCMVPWSKLKNEERKKDVDAVELMIILLDKYGFKICRYKKLKPRDDPYYRTAPGVPLIIGVTGHRDISPEDAETVKGRIKDLLDSYKKRYIHTEILLMTGLAEGVDRAAAKAAIELGIHVAPVLPKDRETFIESFEGQGYSGLDAKRQSIDDFNRILNNEYEGAPEGAEKLVYTECVMDAPEVNDRKAYRDQVAFITSNSHVLIAIWDGLETSSQGGTYDCLRMTLTGIDPDLVDKVTPMSTADVRSISVHPRYLSAAEDTLVYWIKVDRGSAMNGPSEGSSAYIVHKQLLEGQDDESKNWFSRMVAPVSSFVVKMRRSFERVVMDSIFRREKQKVKPKHQTENAIEGSVPLFSNNLVLSPEMPDVYDESFRRIDFFNREMGISDYTEKYALSSEMKKKVEEYREVGNHKLFSKDEALENSQYLKEMKWTYYSSCYQASFWKKKNESDIKRLIILTVAQSILFSLMILFSNSVLLMAVYAFIFSLFLLFSFQHVGREEHLKFVEYSSLSQSLMVQYYWSILGINDSVSMNCYAYIKNKMIWIRFLMKSFCSPFCNDYQLPCELDENRRLDAVVDSWINESRSRAGAYIKEAGKKRSSLKGKQTIFRAINAFISITVVFMALVISLYSIKVFEIDQWGDGKMTWFPQTDITWFVLVKIILILVAAITAYFSLRERTNYDVDEDQMRATAMLLDMAASKISMQEYTSDENILKTKLSIIHELGIQIVNSSNDWVFKYINQDIKKEGGKSPMGAGESDD